MRPHIAIYKPHTAQNENLYASLLTELNKAGAALLVDDVFLISHTAMGTGLVDILVVPELDCVPHKNFRRVKDFMDGGGAVLLSGGDLFMTGQVLREEFSQFTVEEQSGEKYFQHTTGHLGIKPYVGDFTPTRVEADADFLSAVSGSLEGAFSPWGGGFNVGSDVQAPLPPYGHVFPERYEVLRNFEVLTGTDPLGRRGNVLLTFAQNWETGGRYVLCANNGLGTPLDTSFPGYSGLLRDMVDFCVNKVMAVDVRTDYALYRQKEAVKLFWKARNVGAKKAFEVEVSVLREGTTVFTGRTSTSAGALDEVSGEFFWKPDGFDGDVYDVILRITGKDGRLLSKASNGFVVWDQQVVDSARPVNSAGKYFDIGGKPSYITGTNYYESNIGEAMWVRPNIGKLAKDLRQMAEDGINYIRIHYHHAKWFPDYMNHVAGFLPEQYQGLDVDYLPDERILRIFDAHIYLCQKHNIIYGGDLFTLLPDEMGDLKGWFGVQEYLYFEEKIQRQLQFLDLLIPRYVDVPAIAWDIYNEPRSAFVKEAEKEFNRDFLQWALRIKRHMRLLGDKHLITVGTDDPTRFDEAMDFYAEHRNWKYAAEVKSTTDKPEMFQEVWMDRPPSHIGDAQQLSDMRSALIDTFRTGLAGFAPWQWTNQARLWCDKRTYSGEIWDDRLGACVRNDSTLKPSGRFYRDFSWLVRDLHFLVMRETGVIETDQGILQMRAMGDISKGECFLSLEWESKLLRAIGAGGLKGCGVSLSTDADCDVWLWQKDGVIYIKGDGACTLWLEGVPATRGILEAGEGRYTLPIENGALTIQDWQAYYWIRLT